MTNESTIKKVSTPFALLAAGTLALGLTACEDTTDDIVDENGDNGTVEENDDMNGDTGTDDGMDDDDAMVEDDDANM